MKATLEFQLPEEGELHRIATNSDEIYHTLMDIDELMRRVIKHGDERLQTREELAMHVRQMISDIRGRVE